MYWHHISQVSAIWFLRTDSEYLISSAYFKISSQHFSDLNDSTLKG